MHQNSCGRIIQTNTNITNLCYDIKVYCNNCCYEEEGHISYAAAAIDYRAIDCMAKKLTEKFDLFHDIMTD